MGDTSDETSDSGSEDVEVRTSDETSKLRAHVRQSQVKAGDMNCERREYDTWCSRHLPGVRGTCKSPELILFQ